MSIFDQKAFLATTPPFDNLQTHELDIVTHAVNIAYFKVGETVITQHTIPVVLYIIVKGVVQAMDGDTVDAVYFTQDTFDAPALFKGSSRNNFVVQEELICYVLPKVVFLNLIQRNDAFATFYQQDLAKRLASLVQQRDHKELASFMATKIKAVPLFPPPFVEAKTSIYQAVQTMAEMKTDFVLVRDQQTVGIVTDKDLRDHVVLRRYPIDKAIGPIATYDLVGVDREAFLLNALVIMVNKALKHLVIYTQNDIVGVVKQIDLLSYLSNHTHLITVQIEQAKDLAQLKVASQNMLNMIQSLYANGMKITYIMQWIQALNRQLFSKLYQFIAPSAFLDNTCLIVLGSEGRGEQILKTDQDNALIIRDDFTHPALEAVRHLLTETLMDFGYPPCPGGIMVNQAQWCQTLAAFKAQISDWISGSKKLLNLAIFLDAHSVAGDSTLLTEAKHHLRQCLQDNQAFFSHFARETLAFETPLGLFTTFIVEKDHDNQLDLKKGGIFPIVQGVRSLALEYNIIATNTVMRIDALKEKKVLDSTLATELQEAFFFMSMLRLRFGLDNLKQQKNADNYITPSRLNKLERDLLKDSFSIVNKFKQLIIYHYKLDQLL